MRTNYLCSEEFRQIFQGGYCAEQHHRGRYSRCQPRRNGALPPDAIPALDKQKQLNVQNADSTIGIARRTTMMTTMMTMTMMTMTMTTMKQKWARSVGAHKTKA